MHKSIDLTCEQSEEVLRGENHDASRVKAEENDLVFVAARLDLFPARDLPARHRLHHVGHHRDGDEETGDVIEHKGWGRGVGRLKRPPHSLSEKIYKVTFRHYDFSRALISGQWTLDNHVPKLLKF